MVAGLKAVAQNFTASTKRQWSVTLVKGGRSAPVPNELHQPSGVLPLAALLPVQTALAFNCGSFLSE